MTLYSAAQGAVRYVPTAFKANAAVEGVKLVNEDAANLLGGLLDIMMEEDDGTGLDNPKFAENGHDGDSPATARYFRAKKTFGALGTMAVAILDQSGLQGGAQAASSAHVWYRVNALFTKLVPPSRRAKKVVYASWYSWEVAKKAVTSGSLEIQMTRILRQKMYGTAGGATKAAVAFGSGGVVGFFVNSAASAWQDKLDEVFGQDVQTLAQGLHWFAFLETVVGRGKGKGPALRILEIIWSEFALGKGSGVTLDEVVREPKGWLVIADLIN
ncbi:hypothetical protein [Mesorhizobium sp. CAU 1741]|uniref:hypothetical protein n=1 Tax=Mesorhizobium sp. CAU 1741 TaxID=3140366 RepID=UPI00325ABEF5